MKCFDQVKISALMIRSFRASQSIPSMDANSILHYLSFFYAILLKSPLLSCTCLEQWRESDEGIEKGSVSLFIC